MLLEVLFEGFFSIPAAGGQVGGCGRLGVGFRVLNVDPMAEDLNRTHSVSNYGPLPVPGLTNSPRPTLARHRRYSGISLCANAVMRNVSVCLARVYIASNS